MSQLTLAIAAKTLFDADLSGQAAGVRDAMAIIQEKTIREMSQAFTLPDWVPLPGKIRERRAIRYLHDLVAGMIRERRASGEDKGDLLSKLLLAVDEEGDHKGMTDRQAEDEAVTLLLAGYETIANALVWTMYLLARYPEVQTKMSKDIAHVLGGRPPGVDDLPKLAALERVVKESLRLYPPAYFYSREAAEEAEVGGYRVPRGSLVHFVPYLVHRDPRWFEQPAAFLPDRFLPEREAQLPPFAYFPFGGGPHVCIGKAFAMMEAVLILATTLQRFLLSPVHGQGEPELVMQITLQLKGGLRLQLKRREA
jgi:cytochrome P450